MSSQLTNDTKDTENYVECRIPMLMALDSGSTEDGVRRFLYASCEMDKYADFHNYESKCFPITKGHMLFTMLDKGNKVEQYLWILDDQKSIPKEPNFIKIDEEVLNNSKGEEEPKKECNKV